ncbi:hypothetical protein [Arthrobacter sp. NPDC090010]|uniref:hypothetical protein n=1 Tax=Arthrobacter sp. NPDC090010 TaxID=3363942 RepID=UPI00382CFAEC
MARQGQSSRGGSARKVSPAVYRRRRVAVLGVLLVVLALLAWGVFGVMSLVKGSGKDDAAATQPTGAVSTPGATPSSTPTTSSTPSCDLGKIKVTATTDKKSYGPKDKPVLTLKVTNEGTVACPVNMGTSQMEFLVSSGQDRIFSSRDCMDKPTNLSKSLAPGKSESANFVWQRNRSVEGCQVINAAPGGGGATYVFQATLGQWTSGKAVFQLG